MAGSKKRSPNAGAPRVDVKSNLRTTAVNRERLLGWRERSFAASATAASATSQIAEQSGGKVTIRPKSK
jgi:hypothetical protein